MSAAIVASAATCDRRGDQREEHDGEAEPLDVDRVRVAEPQGDVGEEVDRGAAEEREGVHGVERLVDVGEDLVEPERASTIPATIGKWR